MAVVRSQRLVAVFVCWAMLLLDAGARAGTGPNGKPKRDAALQAVSAGLTRVIVSTEAGRAGDVETRLRQRGRSVLPRFTLITAVVAEVTPDDLGELDLDPDVTRLSLDAAVVGADASPAGTKTDAVGLVSAIGPPAGELSGNGVGVAVIDSGVQPNGDFSYLRSYDLTDGPAAVPADDYGHGTHVAGLIASRGSLSNKAYVGVAPRVRLLGLKVLDARGVGLTSHVISAIEFAVVNRSTLGIDVINISLGHPILEPAATDPLVQAVEAAVRAGIVVVVSAGNVGRSLTTGLPGYGGILSPGNAPSAITVGALDTKDTISPADDVVPPYSSRGPTWYDATPKPDLVAPGHDLVSNAAVGSTLYTQLPDRQVTAIGRIARFLRLSGTSMSAAVTTGVVALMIEASRAVLGVPLPPAAIKSILAYTALPVGRADPLTQGHGALNAAGAVALTLAVAASQPPTIEAAAPTIAPVTVLDGQSWSWVQGTVWDSTVVWGNASDPAGPEWAQTVVWGNSVWDDTVVWGNADTLDWGTTVIWGNTVVWGNSAFWQRGDGLP